MKFTPDSLADLVVSAMKGAIGGPLVKGRFEALEARVAALEKKPSVKFCGTWDREKTYETGSAVVHHGGLWICKAETNGEPSKDFVGWQLAVKSRSL